MNETRPERDVTTPGTIPKYPEIAVRLSGRDGNVFGLIGRCMTAAKRAGLPREVVDAFTTECMDAESYDAALCVMMDWFDVS